MTTLLTLAVLLVAADTDKKDAPPTDLAKLQGVWKVTGSESRGRAANAAFLGGREGRNTLVVDGDGYVFYSHAGTAKADLGQKTIDFTITDGPYKGSSLPGLLELDGDTLKLAVHSSPTRAGNQRPPDFKTGFGTTHTLYTLQREPKLTKEQIATKLKEIKAELGGGFGGVGVVSSPTQDLLKQILERLDKIDKRLDELDKRLGEKK